MCVFPIITVLSKANTIFLLNLNCYKFHYGSFIEMHKYYLNTN